MYQKGDIVNDRYVIRSIIGNGGSGRVYLAEDINIGKLWALKEIFSDSICGRTLAQTEILALKNLDCPMFPRIIDAWLGNGNSYIVSDYIAGISLGKLIKENPMSKKCAYKISSQIADALIFLHNQNPPILHLDLKPDNVLVKPDGKVCLIDFGISGSSNHVKTGFGTPGFAPPEQYKGAGTGCLSERSDIYAFAATYFAMRTGCIPEADAEVLMEKVRTNSFLSIGEKRLISKCIHVEPEKRIQSMKTVKRYLDRINNSFLKAYIRPFTVTILFAITILSVGFIILRPEDSTEKIRSDLNLISSIGNYSRDEMKIMEDYVNMPGISDEEKSYYLFEIGRTYFEEYEDYRNAKRYFERIDGKLCPQREYYLELCEFQTGFEYDAEMVKQCLDRFYLDVMLMPESKTKYNNLLFIAGCYEHYFDNDSSEENRATEILNGAYERLLKCRVDKINEAWIGDMLKEYKRTIEMNMEINKHE